MKLLTPAVGYVRMSSDKQEASPRQQREEIEQLAIGRYKIRRWYQDDGISGAESTKRKGFLQLITDATEKGDFSAVLCFDQDRFSRFEPIEANYYWHILSEANVKLVTVAQGELDFADLGGWLTASVTQYGKAQYLRDLSRNVLRARLSNARAGRWTGNRAPYGYRLENGRLLLAEPEKVETIRWIFEQYAYTDTTLHNIANKLNERGISPPSERKAYWQRSTIQTILRREAYTGRIAQLKETKGKFFTIRDGSIAPVCGEKDKPASEWFYVDCPQIIDPDLFAKAATKMEARRYRKTPKRTGKVGLLAGVLFCSHCGSKMTAASGNKRDSDAERFYQCSAYSAGGKAKCHRNRFRESTAIDFLIPKLQEVVFTDLNYDRLREAIRKELLRRQRSTPVDIRSLETQLGKVEKELAAVARELKRVPDDLYDLAVHEARKLKARRSELIDQIDAVKTKHCGPEIGIEEMVENSLSGLSRLRERLQDADGRIARGALQEIVSRIDLEFDHVQHAKLVRSHFRKGIVQFNTCESVSAEQSARLTST